MTKGNIEFCVANYVNKKENIQTNFYGTEIINVKCINNTEKTARENNYS